MGRAALRTVGDILEESPPPIGHNGAPEPTPFEAVAAKLVDLETEAAAWFDGTEIETQAQADDVAKLKEAATNLATEADVGHKTEKEPHLRAGQAVDERWRKPRADIKLVKEIAGSALTVWLTKLDDERRAREAEAQRIADEAAEKAREAAAQNDGSLAAAKARDAAIEEADRLAREAAAAAKVKVQAKGSGMARAVGLRSKWKAEVEDHRALLNHIAKTRPNDLREWLEGWASSAVTAGQRTIPGVRAYEERSAA